MGPGADDRVEDAALARRVIAERDPAAESELCRRLYPRIRAYGRRHLRDDASAADLAQQVLVVLIEALRAGKVVEVDRLPAFVMGVCRNTVLDWRRGERRRSALLEAFGPSMAAAAVTAPSGLDRARVIRCLDRLPPRERMIVALTYVAGCQSDEIARELAIEPGHVRVARHRALRRLHDCVTEGGA
jgi:RNA polymerase sigma-70 factor (ECF subfamily)